MFFVIANKTKAVTLLKMRWLRSCPFWVLGTLYPSDCNVSE